jgi:hypothetical protein
MVFKLERIARRFVDLAGAEGPVSPPLRFVPLSAYLFPAFHAVILASAKNLD